MDKVNVRRVVTDRKRRVGPVRQPQDQSRVAVRIEKPLARLSALPFLLFALSGAVPASDSAYTEQVHLNLLPERDAAIPGTTLWVGLRFDLIASNIPAKVGKEALSLYLHDAREHLSSGGRFYVVTVNGLRQFMKRNLNEAFGNYDKLKQGAHYTVAVARRD